MMLNDRIDLIGAYDWSMVKRCVITVMITQRRSKLGLSFVFICMRK